MNKSLGASPRRLAYSIGALALVASLAGWSNSSTVSAAPQSNAATNPGEPSTYVTATILDLIESNHVSLARMWASPGATPETPGGRVNLQSIADYSSTALDMWPTPGQKLNKDSLGELTLNRYMWPTPDNHKMERMNISAMVDGTDNGAYRIGVEAGNGGVFRDIVFCFEADVWQNSNCPLRVTPHGVYVKGDDGQLKKL